MKLVFATHNEHKYKEVAAMMPPHIELVSLTHIGCHEDIPETANTIEGNAKLKADYVRDTYQLDCFADDTGLEVSSLNNEPGVFSARYAGPNANAQANMDKLLSRLEAKTDRSARFKTVIVLSQGTSEKSFTGICEGEITKTPKGDQGFGYDPIFKPKGYTATFAEISSEEKGRIGHRGKALQKLLSHLEESI